VRGGRRPEATPDSMEAGSTGKPRWGWGISRWRAVEVGVLTAARSVVGALKAALGGGGGPVGGAWWRWCVGR
jgi:hypothetical protein